ncbi:MAG: 16S rRNA (cytidine(1402)-2'-O)-methyltransferase [Peptoniphilus harei]|nr:16S rRNA (cytidine(1402)-2'-O)-methyltransferase [Peptoniphilus harei]
MIYFCPTPIGNLGDITLRTIKILKSVDIIFAEDKRVTVKLLNHYDIKAELRTYHKFNEAEMSEKIIENIKDKDIALVTDAGMPGISDPGAILVRKLIEENIDFRVLPGPNAALTALVLSGLDTDHFLFYGFTANKSSARKKEFESLKDLKFTLIFYEAPHRIKDFLRDLYEVFGDRKISISREITKVFEETTRSTSSEILEKEITEKGEFVICLEGKTEEDTYDIRKLLEEELKKGMKKSQAVKEISKKYNIPKNDVYKESLDL